MANQRSPRGVANTNELRTTATTANQVLVTIDLTALFGKAWNGAVFALWGYIESYQEDGSTDYTGFKQIVARAERRAGVLTVSNPLDPNNDTTLVMNGALSTVTPPNFFVSGNTIQLRITPLAGNYRHYSVIEAMAYQYT